MASNTTADMRLDSEKAERMSFWDNVTSVQLNPLNLKCKTLPIFSFRNPYSRNFHLSWLGFWVAFLSWFAFSPLVPEAVKADLHLTSAQIGNSNVVSLCATLIVRVIVGPLVDRYGPRKVMAAILALGAIPSGLAGTVNSAGGLYVIRFFIGILGGTFVPCQAWTTTFFDKSIVGRANALVAGWGNSGGGFTFLIMVALYDRLIKDGLSSHSAWRAAFAIIPVPVLLLVSVATMVFGTDHPNGKWRDRHNIPGTQVRDVEETENDKVSSSSKEKSHKSSPQKDAEVEVSVVENPVTELDTAVNQSMTLEVASKVLLNPLTWLAALAYMITFGYELAIDANLANVLFGLYKSSSFGQTKAGYIASIYGLLNIFTRPLGGYFGDLIYKRFGVPGKKYLMLACGILQGFMSLALGLYIDSRPHPSLAVVIVLFTLTAVVNEAGNGANFALVPHCNPNSNGFMTGLVGAMGNLGGVIFALIFRFQPVPIGRAFWIAGILAIGVNSLLVVIRVPAR